MNKSLFFNKYINISSKKQLAAYDRLQNQLIMKYQRRFLASNICHNEFIIYIRKFVTVNILVRFPINKYK